MITTRNRTIQNKVFSKDNVKNLWAKIKSEYDGSQSSHKSLEIQINCSDGVSYSSESDDLIQDGDVIDNKKCSQISIDYHDYSQNRRISLSLSHGEKHGNSLLVKGDKNWTAGTFDTLNEVIESTKPQDHWLVKHKTLFLLVVAIALGYYFSRLIDFLPTSNEESSASVVGIRDFLHKNPIILNLVKILLFWLSGIIPAMWLRDWTLKLWPHVEFDFGPEHKKVEKNRRQRLGLVFSIIILPLLLSFIYDQFKK